MIDYKWKSGQVKADAETNKIRNVLKRLFLNVLEKFGFNEVDLPTLDYSDSFIINNEYFASQNHFKSIAPNGEVLSLGDDVIKGLLSFSQTELEDKGKICSKMDAYAFIDDFDGKSYDYQVGGLVYGTTGLEEEADLLMTAIEVTKALKAEGYKLYVGNIDIFGGVLNSFAGSDVGVERLRAVLKGNLNSDYDYAASQTLASVKNAEGDASIIKDLAQKLENKKSLDGLVNLFEVMNIIDAYGERENVIVSPGYIGKEKYDKGLVFEVRSNEGKSLVYGGRCDCLKGQDKINALYIRLNVENAIEELKKSNALQERESKKVLIAVAETRVAIAKANKVRQDLMNENFICDVLYNATESTLYEKMNKYKDRMIVYVDGEGNITHS